MKKCHKCSRTYDDTWGVCLLCGERLGPKEESALNEGRPEKESPDKRKKLVVRFSILMIAAILLFLYIIYLTYFQEMDRDFSARERLQLRSAIISDKNIIE